MAAVTSAVERATSIRLTEIWRQDWDHGEADNLAHLQAWMVVEHGYTGSLGLGQREYVAQFLPLRARRRVKPSPGPRTHVDWTTFPAMIVGRRHNLPAGSSPHWFQKAWQKRDNGTIIAAAE